MTPISGTEPVIVIPEMAKGVTGKQNEIVFSYQEVACLFYFMTGTPQETSYLSYFDMWMLPHCTQLKESLMFWAFSQFYYPFLQETLEILYLRNMLLETG